MSNILIVIVLAASTMCGCRGKSPELVNGPAATSSGLTISAAVSLKDAFNEIGNLYQQKTGTAVSFNFGASGALQQQIEAGAPVDVFASAGEKQMNELSQKGLIDIGSRRNFARNSLVLVVPIGSELNITGLADLTRSNVLKIAVGNPKTVPAGQYSDQLLAKMNVKDAVQAKLVIAEDVRQVLDYVARGEADAGIVYATDARIANARVRVVATAPTDSHDPIVYPIALIKDSKQNPASQAFVAFIMSPDGQAILQKYGFENASDK